MKKKKRKNGAVIISFVLPLTPFTLALQRENLTKQINDFMIRHTKQPAGTPIRGGGSLACSLRVRSVACSTRSGRSIYDTRTDFVLLLQVVPLRLIL